MLSHRLLILTLVGTLALPFLTFIPSATAQVAGETESFCPTQNGSEFGAICNDAYGEVPISGDSGGVDRFYTYVNSDSCAADTCEVRLINGEAVWQSSLTSGGARLDLEDDAGTDYDFCDFAGAGNLQVGVTDSDYSITWDFQVAALSGTAHIGLGNSQANPDDVGGTTTAGFFGLHFTATNLRGVVAAGTTSTLTDITELSPPVIGDWYTATISQVSCEHSGEPVDEVNGFHLTITHGNTTVEYDIAGAGNFGGAGTQQLKELDGLIGKAVLTSSATVYIDNVTLEGTTGTPEGFSESWCSDPNITDFEGDGPDGAGDDDFGWNYVEQVEFEDPAAGDFPSEFQDAYTFTSQSDNYAYAGKGWTHTGTEPSKIRSVFRIEADTEFHESRFRSIFSFIDGTPSSTTKGNGDDTQAFADHVAARFREVGNDWRINLEYTIGGVGPTEMGSAVTAYNPNSPTTFMFVLDTVAGYAAVLDSDGEDILNQTIDVGFLAVKLNDPITSHWFITSGSSSLLNSYTFLDDNSDAGQTDDSTCLFFGTPVLLEGSQGTVPGSQVPPSGDDPSTGGGAFSELFDPDNIDGQLFIGFLLVAGMVFMGIRQGFPAAGIGALFFIGLFLGYALGWVPLWIILVLFVISLAAVWFLPKPSGDGV